MKMAENENRTLKNWLNDLKKNRKYDYISSWLLTKK